MGACAMPTYTYSCESCGHRYDAFQSMTVEPDKICPECGGPIARLIGAGAGVVFKGSGFYVTDYRKDNGSKSRSESSESSGSSGGKESGGTDSAKKEAAPKKESASGGSSGSSSTAS